MRQHYKVLLTFIFVVIFIIASGLLLGILDATETTDCESLERIGSECVPQGPKPICPKRIGSECVPRGPKPICPSPHITLCPLDAAGQGEQPYLYHKE